MSTAQEEIISAKDYKWEVRKNFRWNFAMFLLNGVFFHISLGFLQENSILSVFVRALGGSDILVGSVTTIRSAGWFLPQLIIANYIGHKKRYKPYVVLPLFISRLFFLPFVIFAYFYSKDNLNVVLLLFFLVFAIFSFGQGMIGVPWTSMMAKAIPATHRGRLIGGRMIIGGGLTILAGLLIKYILGNPSLTFPQDYAIIFFFCFITLQLSTLGNLLIREPLAPYETKKSDSLMEYLRGLPAILKGNKMFARAMLVKLLSAFLGMATPFYALYATESLGVNTNMVGLFVSASMLGKMLSSMMWGYISDKISNKLVIQLVLIIMVLTPLSAVLIGVGANYGVIPDEAESLGYIYLIVYFLMGFIFGGEWMGFLNYTLEIANQRIGQVT